MIPQGNKMRIYLVGMYSVFTPPAILDQGFTLAENLKSNNKPICKTKHYVAYVNVNLGYADLTCLQI
jgi:hypothetical protein